MNEEFSWSADFLSKEPPVQGVVIKITKEMVSKTIIKVKTGKAAGPPSIVIQMIKAPGDQFVDYLISLFNQIVYEGIFPTELHLSHIFNLFRGKENMLLRGKYRGLKLQVQLMKVLEYILNSII